MNPIRLLPRATTAAVLLLAIGCGGGGGGTGELTVSEQNAAPLAASGIAAVSMVEGMSEMVDGMTGVFDQGSALVMPCDSGNVMLNVYDLGTAGLSTGDYASMDFNNCMMLVEGQSLMFRGGLYLRADEITGDPDSGPFTRELYGSYDDLTATVFGAMMRIDGGISASLSSADGETFTLVVDIGRFSASAQADGATFSGSLDDFHSQRTWNEKTGAYTVQFEGTIRAYALGGSAHFETTEPFTGNEFDGHPSAGTLVATGALGGTVTLIALDSVNVRILIDADGDQTAETTVETTWAALENS